MRPARPPTLDDVAARAGVSKMTASHVLNGSRSGTRVSADTRARICAVAQELHYHPNALARGLSRRRTDIIGFCNGYSQIEACDPLLSHIIAGLQDGCEDHGKHLLLHGRFRGSPAESICAELADGKIDGLILFAPPSDPLIARLRESHLRVVAVGEPVPGIPSVVGDDWDGARLLVAHLKEKGHHCVYCGACPHGRSWEEDRQAAFLECAAASDVETVAVPGRAEDHIVSAGDWLAASGAHRIPTAAVCWDDASAIHLLAACLRAGLHIPDELAIVGFDGAAPDLAPRWRLTTVRVPWRAMASRAVSLLADQMSGQETALETVLPVELLPGNTT